MAIAMRPMRRLRALDAAITSKASHGADTTPRGADAAPAAGAMAEFPPAFDALSEPPKLLDDDAVKQFLVDGCLALPLTDLPTAFHRDLQAHSRSGFERLQADGLEDRYVYNELPEMGEILSSPQTRGALVSLLGPGYAQHPHRSMHVQGDIDDGMPRIGDGGWHKDGHHVPMRHHVPRWIIGFYYPFPCTLDMGPTGVIPGSHLLSNGPYNDGGWSQAELSDAELEHCGGDPAAEHDAKLAAAASALYPGAVERKTAVGDLCHPESGTLFLLNFGILHRRCTRLPGSLWRNMFKLQFFRTAAPSVSWNHAAPASSSNEQPFAYTGASLEQQAVYEAAWDWLRDADPEPPSPFLLSASELGAGLLSDKEYERVSSAYSLGRRASAGDVAAAEILESALRGEDDDRSRSAMYGLGGAGEAVVQLLLRTLRDSRVARDWRTQINAAHGLCEAVRSPSSEVQTELTLTLDAAVGVMAECVAESQGLGVRELSAAELAAISKANGPAYHEKKATATAGYLEDEANALIVSSVRRCYSACIHALGTMGERAVAAGDHEMVNSLAETLLPFTVAPDPGASLEQYGNNGRASQGIRPGQSEFWSREGGAIGLLRLASGDGGLASLVTESTPGHHGDDRFIPALCQYAAARVRAGGSAPGLEEKLDAHADQWQADADKSGAASLEPWLAQSLGEAGSGSGVVWQV